MIIKEENRLCTVHITRMYMYYKFQKRIFKSKQDLECSCKLIKKKKKTNSKDISLKDICYFFQITDPSWLSEETRFL